MKLILLQDIPNLGRKNDVIDGSSIKAGFLKNKLIPQNLVRVASKADIAALEKAKAEKAMQAAEIAEKATELKTQLEGKVFTIQSKANEEGHLFGSVTEKEVLEIIAKDAKLELNKDQIAMESHIKEAGEHTVTLKLSNDTHANVTLKVEGTAE